MKSTELAGARLESRTSSRWMGRVLCIAVALVSTARGADPPWLVRGRNGLVASDSPYASQAGLEILKAGGNAIDAAVAVSFALAVTRPYNTGLGGGGFMIARFADGRVVVQDFRETAPSAATPDMYAGVGSRSPTTPLPSRFGHLAVAVPGLVAGRCQALSQFGTMSLEQTLAPAIRLAKEGYPVDQHYVDTTREVLARYEKHPSLKVSCHYVYETHLRGGRLRNPGETLVQPKLARLLEGIARNGPDFFYQGPVAFGVAREMKKHGGIITKSDLAGYKVLHREPIRSTYRGYELIGMPPPSSGGVALTETLNILETLDLPSMAKRDPGLAVHYQVEAMKHAFADRARWLGDSDFAHVPVPLLTSQPYAVLLAGLLDPEHCSDSDTYGSTDGKAALPAQTPRDSGTSHFCVADQWGNVVVSSETINTSFGSLTAIDEWGLILNNEMDDFTSKPGKPNAFGLVQSARNAIAPGKRPLSSMSPTIVLKDGEPFLALGASGGPRIISSVLNVFLAVTDFGMSLEQAMLRPRPHHQWQPDMVFFDAHPPQSPLPKGGLRGVIRLGLTNRGHKISDKRRTSVVQAILRTKNGWVGASDPRKGGRPAGF